MAPTPTIETVITAIKTAMDAIASLGTVLTGFHTREDEVSVITRGGYISSGSMNLWFIDCKEIRELEGEATQEFYEQYVIQITYWSLRTNNADWSKEARQKAESVRDALTGVSSIFAINYRQITTPETVQIAEHGPHDIAGAEGTQRVYRTVLELVVEARRW